MKKTMIEKMMEKVTNNSTVYEAIVNNMSKLPWELAATIGATLTIKPIVTTDTTVDYNDYRNSTKDTAIDIETTLWHEDTHHIGAITIDFPKRHHMFDNNSGVRSNEKISVHIVSDGVDYVHRSYIIDSKIGEEVTVHSKHTKVAGFDFVFEIEDLSVSGIAAIAGMIKAMIKSSEDYVIAEFNDRSHDNTEEDNKKENLDPDRPYFM